MKKSIAIFAPISNIGGAELSVLEITKRLGSMYDFHFILPGDGPLKAAAEKLGVSTWVLPWPRELETLGEVTRPGLFRLITAAFTIPLFTRQLSQVLEDTGARMLITNAIKCHVIASLARRSRAVPLVWYMRDGMEQRRLSRRALRLVRKRCHTAICISQYIAGEVRNYISSNLPTSVIYNIVDFDRFQPGLPLPLDLKKEPAEIWFANVGAITPLKGQDLFLQAAHVLSQQLPEARFLLIGSNFYATQTSSQFERDLRIRAECPELQGKVKFLGFRDDIPEILANVDVLVQCNRGPEGLGRSVIEGMASGAAVVAVNRWGPAELVIDGHTGLSFPVGDVNMLVEAMLRLGRDSAMRQRLGCNARAWVQQNLSSQQLVGQTRRCFEQIFRLNLHSLR